MTFRRGAALTTATSLGYADTADLGPTDGNGFHTRWADDLAVLAEIGVTDVRVTLDWARLQPRPATFDADWAERFEQILREANAIGLRPWACLHDGSIPRWFDNDGGFDDVVTFTTWWPRWVERVAERFGDLVAAWIPFACIPAGAPAQPWIDTWGILAGGPAVVAAVDLGERSSTIKHLAGRMNLLGAHIGVEWETDATVGVSELAAARDRWGNEVRDAADLVDHPLVIPGFYAGHHDADTAAEIVDAFRSMLDAAIGDGVAVEAAFVEPAIAGRDSLPALLDADRTPTAMCEAFLTPT